MCKKAIYFIKKGVPSVFNPLNLPYQGDFKKKCVSPK